MNSVARKEIEVMIGDARRLPLKDESVDCIVTSPPYWSLRKYDIPDLIWDGDEKCNHEWNNEFKFILNLQAGNPEFQRKWRKEASGNASRGQFCVKCGAWKGQLGLEPAIELYLKHLLQCFDEVKRVLKPTGTLWVVLGDIYAGSNCGSNDYRAMKGENPKYKHFAEIYKGQKAGKISNISSKSLCLIPYRFAINMIEKGWILRNVIIWHKPNCLPSSVKDRFTVDYEPILFFTKSRKYYFEQQFEPSVDPESYSGRRPRGHTKQLRTDEIFGHNLSKTVGKIYPQRNKRCVWSIPTQPYTENHFATFPEALVENMIRAGCPKEICVRCGKAKMKIYINKSGSFNYRVRYAEKKGKQCPQFRASVKEIEKYQDEKVNDYIYEFREICCNCNADFRPGIVLDPFCGRGTVMRVAEKLGRIGIGFDLGYAELQKKSLTNLQRNLWVE